MSFTDTPSAPTKISFPKVVQHLFLQKPKSISSILGMKTTPVLCITTRRFKMLKDRTNLEPIMISEVYGLPSKLSPTNLKVPTLTARTPSTTTDSDQPSRRPVTQFQQKIAGDSTNPTQELEVERESSSEYSDSVSSSYKHLTVKHAPN